MKSDLKESGRRITLHIMLPRTSSYDLATLSDQELHVTPRIAPASVRALLRSLFRVLTAVNHVHTYLVQYIRIARQPLRQK